MADRKISLSIAGHDIVCNFGTNFYYKDFYEQTGDDLLVKYEEIYAELATSKVFKRLPQLYYAAYTGGCHFSNEEIKLKFEDFQWAMCSPGEVDLAKFLSDFLEINKGQETNGEEKKTELQTASP